MKTVAVKLPVDLEIRLQAAVAQRRTTRSRFLRDLIAAHLRATRPAKDSALARAGDLVGCLSGGPADLSTNPKHLKGYGR
jgi:metal-responsive CopG/Arc/MetJ family transcriptional regulator